MALQETIAGGTEVTQSHLLMDLTLLHVISFALLCLPEGSNRTNDSVQANGSLLRNICWCSSAKCQAPTKRDSFFHSNLTGDGRDKKYQWEQWLKNNKTWFKKLRMFLSQTYSFTCYFVRQFQGTGVFKKKKSKRQQVRGTRVSNRNKANIYQFNFAVDLISNFNKVTLTFQQAKQNTALLHSINQLQHWKRLTPAFGIFFCSGVCVWSFLKHDSQWIGQKKRRKMRKKTLDLTDF